MPILLGLTFVLVGGCIVLAGAGVISIGRMNSPPWVIVCIGLFFVFGGVMLWRAAYMVLNTRHEPAGRNVPAPTGEVCAISPVEGIGAVIGGWIVTIVLCSLIGYMAYQAVPSDPISGIVTNLVLHPWIEIGIALVSGMTLITLGLLRYGRIPLYIKSATARAGETFEARLTIKKRDIVRAFKAKLTCHALQVTRGRKNRRHTSITVHWSFAIEGLEVGPLGLATIRIAVPPDLPGATTSLAVDHLNVPGLIYYHWILEISADVWGIDLHRHYEIPMQPALPGALLAARNAERRIIEEVSAEMQAEAEKDALEKAQAVFTVMLAELAIGKPIDAIADKLTGMGVAEDVINAGLERIVRDASSPHATSVRDWLAHQRQLKEEIDSGRVMMLDRAVAPVRKSSAPGSDHEERAGSPWVLFGTLVTFIVVPVAGYFLPDMLGINKNGRLVEAVSRNQQDKVASLLADGADPNQYDEYGRPLWHVALSQRTEVLEALFRGGADLSVTDHNGNSPLMYFAGDGNVKWMKLLLDLGADVNERHPKGGASPLHLAAVRTSAAVELLLDAGANINAVDAEGVTSLMLAAAWGKPETITALMYRGADFELRDRKGRNAFDRAYSSGNRDNLNTLVNLARRRMGSE